MWQEWRRTCSLLQNKQKMAMCSMSVLKTESHMSPQNLYGSRIHTSMEAYMLLREKLYRWKSRNPACSMGPIQDTGTGKILNELSSR